MRRWGWQLGSGIHIPLAPRRRQAKSDRLIADAGPPYHDRQAAEAHDDIRDPRCPFGAEAATHRRGPRAPEQHVVDEDDCDPDHEAAELAVFAVVGAEGESNQREDRTGHWQRRFLLDHETCFVGWIV